MKKYIALAFLMAFTLQSCELFNNLTECKPIINNPNAEVKPMIDTLQARGFDITQLQFDDNGFPYFKGEYVIELSKNSAGEIVSKRNSTKTYTIQDALANIKNKMRGVPGYGKCFTDEDITFEYCECNAYVKMTIKSDVVGNPTSQSIEQRGTNSDFVTDINPNYINYHSESVESLFPLNQPYLPSKENKAIGPIVGLLDSGFQPINSSIGVNYLNFIPCVSTINVNTCDNMENEGTHGINFMEITSHNPYPIFSTNYQDDNGHGSHIASNILQNAKLSILPVKIQDKTGAGTLFSAVCGIKYAVRKGVKMINASWVFHHSNPDNLSILKGSIADAGSKGVVFITAAGNDGKKLGEDVHIYPAMFYDNDVSDNDNVIVVGAYKEKTLANYSNRNKKYVDIAAIGKTYNFILGQPYYSEGTSFSVGLVVNSLGNFMNSSSNIITLPANTIKTGFYSSNFVQTQSQFTNEVNNNKTLVPPTMFYP